jgi:5-methyltetrahydropteroyltriglutamate--homocysteine methyltransferase
MIKSCDVGSLPLIDNERTFLEGAAHSQLLANEKIRYFEEKVTEAFLDKVAAGIDVPNYPQFRDMSQMFLGMIDGVEKTKKGYIETGVLSLRAGKSRIPEISAIKKSSQRIYQKTGGPFKLRVCVTGPYTLSSLFRYRDSGIFTRLGGVISKIIEDNVFSGKYGGVVLVAVDEPIFGLLDDSLIDHGSEGRENLRKAWDSIFQKASSKGMQTCIHLHNTADRLFWEIESLNIIESHVNDPLYHTEKTRELLESTDKSLKASICITDFDRLIRNRVIVNSKQKLNESSVNQRIAQVWKDITNNKLDPKIFLEDQKRMHKRLIKILEEFGAERVPYAGPECGLISFPTYESALECLRRVSKTIKKLHKA